MTGNEQGYTHRVYTADEGWHDSTEPFPPFRTMDDVREANRAIGHHWFDRETLRFFHSRIGDTLYGGRFFVSSECREPGETPRLYTVREAKSDGTIDTVGEFQAYGSRAAAIGAIRELLEAVSEDA